MTLFGFGTATIDIRITTAELGTDYRAKLLAREARHFGGGAAANSLYQATLLGASTQWLGKLGRDYFGRVTAEDLSAHDIGIDHVVYDEKALSAFNLAVYAGEENRRVGGFLLPNCLAEIGTSDLDAWCSAIDKSDWCLVEVGEIPIPVVLDLCLRLRATGTTIVLDIDLDPLVQCVGGSRRIVHDLFSTADYILPNLDAVSGMYGSDDPVAVSRAVYHDGNAVVVTTAGADGAYYTLDGVEVIHVAAPEVEVIDTVGAGDAFHGAFVWSLMGGVSVDASVETASLCGAANCAAFGAREGMLDADRLARFARRPGRSDE